MSKLIKTIKKLKIFTKIKWMNTKTRTKTTKMNINKKYEQKQSQST